MKTDRTKKNKRAITTSVEKITPHQAREWLKSNTKNRGIRKTALIRMVRDMKAQVFDCGTDDIRFDWNEVLIDGQHRLHACVMADTPFESVVIRGLDPAIRTNVGTGVGRTGGDLLGMAGEKAGVHLSGILGNIWRLNRETLGHNGDVPSRHEMEELLEQYPDTRRSAQLSYQMTWKRMGRPSMLGFCHWAFVQKDETMADLFFDGLVTGDGIRSGEPVFQLREQLLINRGASKKMGFKQQMGLIIKAWNLTRAGKKVRMLVFKVKLERIPDIL